MVEEITVIDRRVCCLPETDHLNGQSRSCREDHILGGKRYRKRGLHLWAPQRLCSVLFVTTVAKSVHFVVTTGYFCVHTGPFSEKTSGEKIQNKSQFPGDLDKSSGIWSTFSSPEVLRKPLACTCRVTRLVIFK